MLKKMISQVLVTLMIAGLASCGGSDGEKLSPAALDRIRNASEISIVEEGEPKGLFPFKTSVQKVLERVFAGLGLDVANGPAAFPVFLVRISAAAAACSSAPARSIFLSKNRFRWLGIPGKICPN